MKTEQKKPVVKKTPIKKATTIKKENQVTTNNKTGEVKVESVNKTLRAKITNLETAYLNALKGKMKFREVKELFKKMHKEIKKTSK